MLTHVTIWWEWGWELGARSHSLLQTCGRKEKNLRILTPPHRRYCRGSVPTCFFAALSFQWPPRKRGSPKICSSSSNSSSTGEGKESVSYIHFANRKVCWTMRSKIWKQRSHLLMFESSLPEKFSWSCFLYLLGTWSGEHLKMRSKTREILKLCNQYQTDFLRLYRFGLEDFSVFLWDF